MRIKIFADTADLGEIERLAKDPQIQGFTTNPSLMRKAGVTDYRDWALKVLEFAGKKPVSFEVVSDTVAEMTSDVLAIVRLGRQIYVKVPVQTPAGESTRPVIQGWPNVRFNITAVFTPRQFDTACLMLESNLASCAIVSVFAGRIGDCGVDPAPLFVRGRSTKIEVLWGGSRTVRDVVTAEEFGADIITLTPDLIAKLPLLSKNLEAYSLETVQQFDADAKAMGYRLCYTPAEV